MVFSVSYSSGNEELKIGIPIEGNKKSRYIDNYNNIINNFEHEKTHYEDYKVMGNLLYANTLKERKELRAVMSQISSPSFLKTTNRHQKSIFKYAIEAAKYLPQIKTNIIL